MKSVSFLILSSLLFFSVTYAEQQVATVDVNKIINSFNESKSHKSELDKLSKNARTKIDAKQKELQALEKSAKSKNLKADSPEIETMRKKSKELQRFIKDTEEELKRKYGKYNKTLTDKAMNAIENYAKSNNIEIVLNKSDGPGPVLFTKPSFDITDKVIASL